MYNRRHYTLLIAAAVLVAWAATAAGQTPPFAGRLGTGPLSTTGDAPLTTLQAFTGNIDAVVTVAAHSAASNPSGTFNVAGIPSGAAIIQAWFITTSFSSFAGETAAVTFAAQSLGSALPTHTDPGSGLFCQEYRFDVTSLVTGNGSYAYSVAGTNNTYGDALVVIYQHSSLPRSRIVVNDGSEGLQGATSTTEFAGFIAAGVGRLIVFTQADDTQSRGGESLVLNGSTVLGPGDIFNQNQGPFASLISIPVSVAAGSDTASIVTGDDFLGLHLAILVGPDAGSTNRDPDCSRAVACEPVLWPPNHAFHAVSICGVTDPDSGDVVTITVTSVTQDEPTNSRGDGNTCPDAQIVNGRASVRAERTGNPGTPGNGRVYAIGFTADDGHGGHCTDTVYVCVPHDRGHPTCTDDGQRYNSLGPCQSGNQLSVELASLAIGDVSNGQAHLTFALPFDGSVEIAAFDIAGRRLATIVNEVLSSGVYERDWHMGGLPKGLYFVRVQAGGVKLTRTVIKLH